MSLFDLNNWTYTENNTEYLLTRWSGPSDETEIRIPGEYNGKQVILNKIESYYIYPSTTLSFITEEVNGRKVKIKSTSLERAFFGKSSIETIDLSGLDTSNITDMSFLCGTCKGLTSINLTGIDTSNVTNMEYMFNICSSLTSLDVSGFDTSNVTDMGNMFNECSKISTLDVSGFDTSNVTDMGSMFGYCSSLTSLNLGNFNTSKVTDMRYMFKNCSNINSLDLRNFDTSKVTIMNNMFSGCLGITSLDLRNFDTSELTNMGNMFDGCKNLVSVDLSSFNTPKLTSLYMTFNDCYVLKTIKGLNNFDTSNVTSLDRTFCNCREIISLDVSNFDTSNVTIMQGTFRYCYKLTSLDVSNFNTSKVYNMWAMFDDCRELASIDVSNFDTSQNQHLGYMFSDCYKLTSLDLSNFNTSKVSLDNFRSMFQNCKSLETLDLSSFDTSNATDFTQMFYGCVKLKTLNVSSFNTEKVTRMRWMFMDCESLTSLDLSSFDTSNVEDMSDMFYNCASLTSLDVSHFDTSKVTDMSSMFNKCRKLISLDVSNFNTSKVTNMSNMFQFCNELTSLNLRYFETTSLKRMDSMFWGCDKLTYLDLSNFDLSHNPNMSLYRLFYVYNLTPLETRTKDPQLINYDYLDDRREITILPPSIERFVPAHWRYTETKREYILHQWIGPEDFLDIYIPGRYRGKQVVLDKIDSTMMPVKVQSFILEEINNQKVKFNSDTLEKAFHSKSSIHTIDLSGLDTSNITNTKNMFNYCSKLVSLNLKDFKTSKVVDMDRMFCGCSNLPTLDITGFDTSSVTTMENMFNGCSSLLSLDLSSFDTSNVEYMDYMFKDCYKLNMLDLTNFDTTNLKSMSEIFSNCSGLTYIALNRLDTSNVENMSRMFYNCYNLISLDLSNFRTSKVKNMSFMFYKCAKLIILDLSNFDISNVTDNYRMFYVSARTPLKLTADDERILDYDFRADNRILVTPPVIHGEDIVINRYSPFKPLEYITAEDYAGKKIVLTNHNTTYNTIDTSVVGTFEITYEVSDAYGYTATKTINIRINDVATIIAEDRVIQMGKTFNPLEGVRIIDSERNEIPVTDDNIYYDDVDTEKAGEYKVVYSYSDNYGLTATKTINVKVSEQPIRKLLFPPIVPNSLPAFSYGKSTFKFYFKPSIANSISQFNHLQMSIVRQDTNETILKKSGGILFFGNKAIKEDKDKGFYYCEPQVKHFPQADIPYKIQVRLGERDTDKLGTAGAEAEHDKLSEWSIVTIVMPVTPPRFGISDFSEDYINHTNQIDYTGFLFHGFYETRDPLDQETLSAYRYNLYSYTDIKDKNTWKLLSTSKEKYVGGQTYPNLEFSFPYELEEKKNYIVSMSIKTRNLYTDTKYYKIYVYPYSAIELPDALRPKPDPEEGQMLLSLRGKRILFVPKYADCDVKFVHDKTDPEYTEEYRIDGTHAILKGTYINKPNFKVVPIKGKWLAQFKIRFKNIYGSHLEVADAPTVCIYRKDNDSTITRIKVGCYKLNINYPTSKNRYPSPEWQYRFVVRQEAWRDNKLFCVNNYTIRAKDVGDANGRSKENNIRPNQEYYFYIKDNMGVLQIYIEKTYTSQLN